MKVHLTFDVEVWCNGWDRLDQEFPAAFERYVHGHSAKGDYALPATLAIMNRHGLRGVFFVEPLFAARFGERHLAEIVQMIEAAGQQVQLHLHPEWVDEISPPPIADASRKRQHLSHYTRDEQTQLLGYGLELLRRHTTAPVYAFRAGSYAANLDTYAALAAVGLHVDSSLNRAFDVSAPDLGARAAPASLLQVGDVSVYPVATFRDGLGRLRPAQVGACGLAEMQHALSAAAAAGRRHFVIVSHNFEMLRPGRSEPDPFVVHRFEGLCRFLASRPDEFQVETFPEHGAGEDPAAEFATPAWPTLLRLGAQAARRCL